MLVSEQLRAAKALIPTEAHWSSAHRAHAFGLTADQSGHTVDTFCTIGAAQFAVTGRRTCSWQGAPPTAATDALCMAGGFDSWVDLGAWNDDTATFADVHALFDKAIAQQEAVEVQEPADGAEATIMAASEAFADFLTDAILAERPDVDRATVRDTVRPEVLMCAFDVVYGQWARVIGARDNK